MGSSINILNTPVKKMGCVDITNVFNVLIIVMILMLSLNAMVLSEPPMFFNIALENSDEVFNE